MFFFLIPAVLLSYNWLLILAAVIPAVVLVIRIRRADRLEKESPALIRSLVLMGIISTFFALISERVLSALLNSFAIKDPVLYNVILYFAVVGLSEETAKYVLLKLKTWKNREFNCQFDGVVYAVTVSLGFALWENINYVMMYGFGTALVRAVTAIPGHACFGVFMGLFYGQARRHAFLGNRTASKVFRVLSVLIPALIHGAYDFIASMQSDNAVWYFIGFVAVLFIVSNILVSTASKNDRRIDRHYSTFEIVF